MHRAGRFSHMGAVALANRNVFRNSARLIVLVNPVRGLLKCSRPIFNTQLRVAFRSLEATA